MTITVGTPTLSKPLQYGEFVDGPNPRFPQRMRICKVPVSFNGTITEAVAHCVSVLSADGSAGFGDLDDAPMKWANVSPGDRRLLVGGMTVGLGLFEIHDDGVYLHTVSDTFPKKPIITEPGSYVLGFRIDSADHCTRFEVRFNYADHTVGLGPG